MNRAFVILLVAFTAVVTLAAAAAAADTATDRAAVERAALERSFGFHSAISLTPQASVDLIGQRARAALRRLSEFKPLKVQTPVTVDVSFKNYMPSEILAYLPMFERTDSHSVRFRAKEMVEASMIMTFLGEYRADITP